MRKIVFSHRRALGDCLMFTAGVRDFKILFPDIAVNVHSNFPELWENNPYLDRSLKKGRDGVEFHKVGYPIINNANQASTHFTQGFLFDMIASANRKEPLPLSVGEFCAAFQNGENNDPVTKPKEYTRFHGICQKFARQRADIYLTEAERKNNVIREIYGHKNYWVVAPGGKRDCTCKMWDWRRFQKVIDHFDGRIKFISIGRSDHLIERGLKGVVDMIDKYNEDIRGLIPLVYHSEGVISGITFLMHIAAAMPPRFYMERKPCVSLYGGREPTTFTCYTNHQVLHTNGAYECCSTGGCWQSRVIPLMKDAHKLTRMCHNTVVRDGKTIASCFDTITADDMIRAIEKYYDGNIYRLESKPKSKRVIHIKRKARVRAQPGKEINVIASLQSKGGGEQSALMIADLLERSGWTVNFHPWADVHANWRRSRKFAPSFKSEPLSIKPGYPLLFYANDQIWDFIDIAQMTVEKSAGLIVGINFANGTLPKSRWLAKSGQLKAVVFQNGEKRAEFDRDAIGFEDARRVVLYGAIDLSRFLEVCPERRTSKEDFVILKHCTPDWRKYVTKESENTGEKIHLWQRHIFKEKDVKFYERLLKDTKRTRFEFMEAHPELEKHFREEKRMVFHKWDSMDVGDFLKRGHAYLYRTSNKWRDQYPRVVAEALAAGLPVISEPRDGTRDRMDFGNIGFHCIDYDGFLYAVKILERKEKFRHEMGQRAKEWAEKNLRPEAWVDIIGEVFPAQALARDRAVEVAG